jgi:hypothetical protein
MNILRLNGLKFKYLFCVLIVACSMMCTSQLYARSNESFGTVGVPTVSTSVLTISGFVYNVGNGPSTEQTITVSGTDLTNNITVTPPADYEISTTTGAGFQSTAITLTQASGIVNATTIYIRLKSGLSVNTYNNENIVCASTGATTVNVVCYGVVNPSILTAGGGGTFCQTDNVSLTSTGVGVANYSWTGPNGYTSTSQNPTLTGVTPSMSGTYTVTGSTLSTTNLITNGDFESGNTGFTSSYVSNIDLGPEGRYYVTESPTTTHPAFSNCGDHTSGTGKQMVINGATVAGVAIWSQTVSVQPGQDYVFSYWVQTVHVDNPSILQLSVNGVLAGSPYTVINTNCVWQQFQYNASSGASTSLTLSLVNQNTAASGNDFAIDDLTFKVVLDDSKTVNVTVNPSLPVSVSIAASANPVTSGASVLYTATPTNGGSSPSYQWKVNGVNAGTNSSTFNYIPANGEIVTCVVTSNATCATNNPATSNPVTMTVNAPTDFWIGTIDTDWAKGGNWTTGAVPASGADVVFATVANYGSNAVNDLILDMDRTIGSLINATTHKVIIPVATSLIVNNTITTDGNPDRIYIASSNAAANGSLVFHNPSGLPVYATVEMYSKASWNLGNAINDKYKWQYFGVPVQSLTASPTFDGAYVRAYVETGTTIYNHWASLNGSSSITPFYGYEICQSVAKKYLLKGALVNSNFASGQLAYSAGALYPGQHVLANPYTAAIDISTISFGSQMEAAVYLYNTGTFNDWQVNSGELIVGDGPGQYNVSPFRLGALGDIPSKIPSMQGFLVKAMSNSSNATVGITYNAAVVKNTTQQRAPVYQPTSSSADTLKPYLRLEVNGRRYRDRLWVVSYPTCSREFDNGWDGRKLFGPALAPQIFAVEDTMVYQVDALDNIHNTMIGFRAGEDSVYNLVFTHENLKSKYEDVYLVDLQEDMTINVGKSIGVYPFKATNKTSELRFKIITSNSSDKSNHDNPIKIFFNDRLIFVDNQMPNLGRYYLYSSDGRLIDCNIISPNAVTTIDRGLAPGVYIVKAIVEEQTACQKLVIN